jgi:hypothetical protein
MVMAAYGRTRPLLTSVAVMRYKGELQMYRESKVQDEHTLG